MNQHADDEERALQKHIAEVGAENVIGVFDFGTRGVRLIVGPKRLPNEINETTFKMLGRRPNVGLDVVNKHLPLKAKSLAYAAGLISKWHDLLQKEGVKDVHLISTAWFRWLDNKQQVKDFVRRKTGLLIEPIEQAREGELTLLSLPVLVERWRGKKETPVIDDRDTVVLIDQGGGSLQISWMRWGDRKSAELHVECARFAELGSVARRRDFFRRGGEKGEKEFDDPLDNQNTIRKQVQRTRDRAQSTLAEEPTLPTVRGAAPGKLHVFAVGSAITDLAPDGVYKRHNYRVSTDLIETKLGERLHELNADGEHVRSIWRGMRLPEHQQTAASKPWFKRRKKLDDVLTALFGLPVYQEALKQMGVDGLTVSGYGLSYGYYFAKVLAAKAPQVQGKQPDDRGPYLFISYCHEDRDEVEAEIGQLSALRARVWYDKELRGGERFSKRIADKIVSSAGLIVFLTERSVKRDWVRDEVKFAREQKRLIIPIVLENLNLSNEWKFILTDVDRIERLALGPDRYLTKLKNSVPAKCLRRAAA